MEKRLSVKMAGQTNGPIYDLAVTPGTTPKQILKGLALQGYHLFDAMTQAQFPDSVDIYSVIEDGQKTLAVSEMAAGLTKS